MGAEDGAMTKSAPSSIQWLEDELQQAKAQIAKGQHQLEQIQGHLWRDGEEMQRVQEALTVARAQMATVTSLQEQTRQLANENALRKEENAAMRQAMENALQRWQAILEHAQQESGQTLRRIEGAENAYAAGEQRAAAMENSQKAVRNEAALLRQEMANAQRELEDIKTRTGRSVEANNRLEHETSRISGELDALHRQDDVFSERLQIYLEQMRHLEERLSALASDHATNKDIFQKLDVTRMDIQHLAQRLSSAEQSVEGQKGITDTLATTVDLLGAKLQGHADRLLEMLKQIGSYHQETIAFLTRWAQLQDKQKRRQLTHLEQEIRELKQYDLKLNSERTGEGSSLPLS